MNSKYLLSQAAHCRQIGAYHRRISEMTHDARSRRALLKSTKQYQRQALELANEAKGDLRSGGLMLVGNGPTLNSPAKGRLG
jgi:hypothetical protein